MKLLFLGDSLIEYFDWQKRFPMHKVGNYGVAGESVQGLLTRIMMIKDSFPDAHIIFIMSGINNIAMGDEEFTGYYRVIIERLQSAYPEAAIIANSLLPVNMEYINNESIKKINKSLYDLTRETGIDWLNMYDRFIDTTGRLIKEYLLDDGVHISNEGYTVWSRAVEERINLT